MATGGLQLSLDAGDRIVEDVLREGPLTVVDIARRVLRSSAIPPVVARRVVEEIVAADARLAFRSVSEVGLAGAVGGGDIELADATFCVVDLETTGGSADRDRIVEIGAVRIVGLACVGRFERLCDPGVALPSAITRLTGITPSMLRGRGGVGAALDAFLAFAGDATLVAHNARFDMAFLDAALARRHGSRLACAVVDTLPLARRLVAGGRASYALGALASRFDTTVSPTHRALADAEATAEIFLQLIGLAQERGARRVADLLAIAQPRRRRAEAKRGLVADAPSRPGTYVMRDATGRPLYVGTAGDLRRRTASYVRASAQPAWLERVLPMVERIEYRVAGSPFEARLDEIGLIHELGPPGNRRGARPDRNAYLALDQAGHARLTILAEPGPGLVVGPFHRRRDAEQLAFALRAVAHLRSCRAATPREGDCLEGRLERCLAPCRGEAEAAHHALAAGRLGDVLGGRTALSVAELRERRSRLALALRFEEAARLRDAEDTLRRSARRLRAIREARSRHGLILAPHVDDRFLMAFAVAFGLVIRRVPLARAAPSAPEVAALTSALARAVRDGPGNAGPHAVQADRLDELWLTAAAFRAPAEGLRVIPWRSEGRGGMAVALAAAL